MTDEARAPEQTVGPRLFDEIVTLLRDYAFADEGRAADCYRVIERIDNRREARAPEQTVEPSDWVHELSLVIARARFGPGVTMDGRHNPKPSEVIAARRFLSMYDENRAAAVAAPPLSENRHWLDGYEEGVKRRRALAQPSPDEPTR